MRLEIVEQEQRSNKKDAKHYPVLNLHFVAPPFTRPSGPVHPSDINIHAASAEIAHTPAVITRRKTSG
jgi:hypothetical protein